MTTLRISSVTWNNEIYLSEEDLRCYVGTPYCLKWPKYEIKIKACGEQNSHLDDSKFYILKSEFMTWLIWKVESEPDESIIKLYNILK